MSAIRTTAVVAADTLGRAITPAVMPARVPSVSREHQVALERAMTGAPMIGDPRFIDDGGDILMRHVCLYAAEMCRGRDGLPVDLSGYDAIYLPPATVVFVRADATQAEATRYTIPQHVLAVPGLKVDPRLIAPAPPQTIGAQAESVLRLLKRRRFTLNDEKRLQGEIAAVFDEAGVVYRREVKLVPGSVIDFMLDHDLGLEVKIKGQRKSIYRQCERYCACEAVQGLLLATNAAMGVPAAIGGKPVWVLPLGRAWL